LIESFSKSTKSTTEKNGVTGLFQPLLFSPLKLYTDITTKVSLNVEMAFQKVPCVQEW
jgi:hypothetical protein